MASQPRARITNAAHAGRTMRVHYIAEPRQIARYSLHVQALKASIDPSPVAE
jgi:hypothetical protein